MADDMPNRTSPIFGKKVTNLIYLDYLTYKYDIYEHGRNMSLEDYLFYTEVNEVRTRLRKLKEKGLMNQYKEIVIPGPLRPLVDDKHNKADIEFVKNVAAEIKRVKKKA